MWVGSHHLPMYRGVQIWLVIILIWFGSVGEILAWFGAFKNKSKIWKWHFIVIEVIFTFSLKITKSLILNYFSDLRLTEPWTKQKNVRSNGFAHFFPSRWRGKGGIKLGTRNRKSEAVTSQQWNFLGEL